MNKLFDLLISVKECKVKHVPGFAKNEQIAKCIVIDIVKSSFIDRVMELEFRFDFIQTKLF